MAAKNTWKKKCIELAKQLGVTLVYGGEMGYYEITVEAPKGLEFNSDPGLTNLVFSEWDDDTEEELWKDATISLEYGLSPQN